MKALSNCIFPSNGQFIEGCIVINGEQIDTIVPNHSIPEEAEVVDMKGNYVIPGLVDLQIYGGGGAYFTHDISDDSLRKIYEAHLKRGTTYWLPTLISTTLPNILKAIEVVDKCIKEKKYGILGLHLEGPYLNPDKRGAHNQSSLRKPTDAEITQILEAGKGVIKIMTVAPELFSDKQLKAITDSGIMISAGHSNATYEESSSFFSKGVKGVTHLFNGMSPFESKNPGLVGAALEFDNVWASIIADGVHCDYASIRLAHKLKKGKLYLISDATFIDAPVKEFKFDDINIQYKNNQYYTTEGKLAGSKIALLDAVKNCIDNVRIPAGEAFQMACLYPATLLGLSSKIGRIARGFSSHLIIVNKNFEIEGSIVNERIKLKNIQKAL
jgi:N-acetylglucosamine-6-phosphate deacetylase